MNIQPSSLSLRLADPNLMNTSAVDLEKNTAELSKYKVLSERYLGNFSCLPNELITSIFNYLGAQACKSLSLVSTHIFSLIGMQLPKLTFLDLSQPVTQLSAPALIENLKISSAEELEKGLALGIELEKIISCNCENFPHFLKLARTIEIMPSLKQLKLTKEQFQFLLREETFAKSEAFYLSCLSGNGKLLKLCPKEVKENKQLVLAAVKSNGFSFQYVGKELRSDAEVVLTALKKGSSPFIKQHIGEYLKRDKDFFLKAIAIDPAVFEFASDELKNDPELAFFLLKNRGSQCLRMHIGEDLKRDKGFFLKALAIDPWIFEAADEDLKNDPELIFALLKNKGVFILKRNIGEDLKRDKGFFLKALAIDPWIFEAASEDLRNDPELAFFLLKNGGSQCLRMHIGEDLKRDKGFFLKAVAIDPWVFEAADEDLKNDLELIFALLKNKGSSAFQLNMKEELKRDKDFFLKALDIDVALFEHASENLRNDEELALKVLHLASSSLKYMGEELKKNGEFFLKAISFNVWAYEYAGDEVKKDPKIALELVAKEGTYQLRNMGEALKQDKAFFLKAIAIDPWSFEYAAPELKNDPEIALAVLAKGDAYHLKYIGDELKDNAEFFMAARKIDTDAIDYASPRVQRDLRVLAVGSSFYSFILKLGNFASWARQMWQKGWNWFKSLFKS